MPIVHYEATGFPSEYPTLTASVPFLDASWPEIVHAAITVGRRGWRDVFRHGAHSVFEMVYRAFIVYANLAGAASGGFYKTAANTGLDPSEKSAISYYLGLAFTKLMAGRLLDVHWAMHFDVYAERLGAVLGGEHGLRRPDLLGRDRAGRWHVFEAKGRTNSMTSSDLANAKGQAGVSLTIGGAVPHLRVASITHFRNRGLEVYLADPEVGKKSLDLDISEMEYFKDYYEPFVALVNQNPTAAVTIDGRTIHVVDVLCADMRIGLDDETLVRVQAGEPVRAVGGEYRGVDGLQPWTLGEDGVFVELGWDIWRPEVMGLEPPKRK